MLFMLLFVLLCRGWDSDENILRLLFPGLKIETRKYTIMEYPYNLYAMLKKKENYGFLYFEDK